VLTVFEASPSSAATSWMRNPRSPVDQAKDLQLRFGERIRFHTGAHLPVEAAAQPAGSPGQPSGERIEVGRGQRHGAIVSILSETDMDAL